MNDIEKVGYGVFILTLAFTLVLCLSAVYYDAYDGEITIRGERFVRVDAEEDEDWCEEWVCEEWSRTIVENNEFCSGIENPCSVVIEVGCVSEKFVRRRC